jgi:hypothetical protein
MDHDTYTAPLGTVSYLSIWVMLLVLLWPGRKNPYRVTLKLSMLSPGITAVMRLTKP